MFDVTNPTTSTDDGPTGIGAPTASRRRLPGVTLALTLGVALVTAGCSAETGPDEGGRAEVPADAAADDGVDEDVAGNETDDDPSTVRQLEDVVAGGEFVELDPGLYTGDLLDGLVISVPEGVGVIGGDDRFANYFFEGTTRDGAAFVLPITGVVPPGRVGSPVATEELDDVLTDVPDDLGSYFDAIPQLEVLDSGETDTYRWWDIQVRPDLGDVHAECGPPGMECISLFGEPTGAVTLNTMTGWMPRVIQPIAKPSVLLWAAGQDGTIGAGHELALAFAEGFAQS